MGTAIVSVAVCTDADTGSYFELATRAGRACLERAEVSPDQVGLVVNAGVFRDSNISEPAIAALIQKRLGIGLEYLTGRIPTFSFDLMNGGTGLVHALMVVQTFLAPGNFDYALIVTGDTHPSTERTVDEFPYHASGAALLLRGSPAAGGFGRLYTTERPGTVEPTAWADLDAAGAHGRSALTVREGGGDPLADAVRVVRACLDSEGLSPGDFATGRAVLLTPAPRPGFREQLAYRLGLPSTAVAGVSPDSGDPYTAAPVHAYLGAQEAGLLTDARSVVFLAADDSSAACLVYCPQSIDLVGAGAGADMQTKHVV